MAGVRKRQMVFLGILFVLVFWVAFTPKLQTRETEEVLNDAENTNTLNHPLVSLGDGESTEEDGRGGSLQSATVVYYGEGWSSEFNAGIAEEGGERYSLSARQSLGVAVEESILEKYWSASKWPLLSSDSLEEWRASVSNEHEEMADESEHFTPTGDEVGRGGGGLSVAVGLEAGSREIERDTLDDRWPYLGEASQEEAAIPPVVLSSYVTGVESEWEMGAAGSLYQTLLDILESLIPSERQQVIGIVSDAASKEQSSVEAVTSDTPEARESQNDVQHSWNGAFGYYEHLLGLLGASFERRVGIEVDDPFADGGSLVQIYDELLQELGEVA